MKKIISMLLSVCVIVFITNISIFAMPNTDTYITKNITTYEEITDLDKLIDLGIEQYKTNPQKFSNENDYTLKVDQLVKETEYLNGTVDKQYVQNSIIITDDNGMPLSIETLADFPGQFWGSKNDSGVTVVLNVYMTQRIPEEFPHGVVYRVDKVVTELNKSGSIYPVGGSHGYDCRMGDVHKSAIITPLQSLSYQSFTLNGDGSFHPGVPGAIENFAGWKGFADITLSNGRNIYIEGTVHAV